MSAFIFIITAEGRVKVTHETGHIKHKLEHRKRSEAHISKSDEIFFLPDCPHHTIDGSIWIHAVPRIKRIEKKDHHASSDLKSNNLT